MKKSVLNTLFQAVKAITGGVTAIKGQLIKGSGYASSASGKVRYCITFVYDLVFIYISGISILNTCRSARRFSIFVICFL